MFSKATKTSLNVLPQTLTYATKPLGANPHSSSSFSSRVHPIYLSTEPFDGIFSNDSRSDVYIRNLYKYMTTASVIGVSSTLLASSMVPAGLFSAGLALTGLGLDHLGSGYIQKTKVNTYTYKDEDGNVQFGAQNSIPRKLAFLSTCLGYGCIIGSLTSIAPVASSVLGASAMTCLFSTLGQLTYTKFVKKEDIKPMQVVLSGVLGGVVGLNLLSSFSSILMVANPLSVASTQINTYIGLLLYNAFTGSKSQKVMEDVQKGKEDHLKHASRFSESWLYSLAPHFVTKFL